MSTDIRPDTPPVSSAVLAVCVAVAVVLAAACYSPPEPYVRPVGPSAGAGVHGQHAAAAVSAESC